MCQPFEVWDLPCRQHVLWVWLSKRRITHLVCHSCKLFFFSAFSFCKVIMANWTLILSSSRKSWARWRQGCGPSCLQFPCFGIGDNMVTELSCTVYHYGLPSHHDGTSIQVIPDYLCYTVFVTHRLCFCVVHKGNGNRENDSSRRLHRQTYSLPYVCCRFVTHWHLHGPTSW